MSNMGNVFTKSKMMQEARELLNKAFDEAYANSESSCIHRWMQMISDDVVKLKDTLRVQVNEDGTVNLIDFRMPSVMGRQRLNVPQEDVAPWIMETISMLRIAADGDLIPELGFRVGDLIYYIVKKDGEIS